MKEKNYFLMTNKKGDYACFQFTNYEFYKKCYEEYKKIGFIDDELIEL